MWVPFDSCSVPHPSCSSLDEPQLQFWGEGCCLYYIGIFTLTSLSFEHHLKHSYLGLKLRWERFGFPRGNKLYLIPAEEILCECLVSFVLLLMKYSCFINKLFMPLSHFNFLILNSYECLNCSCGVGLKSCWEEAAFSLERGTCLWMLQDTPCSAQARSSWVSSALLGFLRVAQPAEAVSCHSLEWMEWKFPLVHQNLTYELGQGPAWSSEIEKAINLT